MIDTHVHYGCEVLRNDLKDIERQDRKAGIEKTLCLPMSYEDNFTMMQNTRGYADMAYAVGIHPLYVPSLPPDGNSALALKKEIELYRRSLDELTDFQVMIFTLSSFIEKHAECVAAIGETGIDIHNDAGKNNLRMQKISFREHIRLAQAHKLPLILHLRGENALEEALSVMQQGQFRNIHYRGIWHCFHGTRREMEKMLEISDGEFGFGIGGIITYPERGAVLRDNLRSWNKAEILSKIVLETDAPFLAPQNAGGGSEGRSLTESERGVRNISANLAEVVSVLAGTLKVSPEEIIRHTTENAYRILHLERYHTDIDLFDDHTDDAYFDYLEKEVLPVSSETPGET